jgi:hypothetical protein
LSYNFSFKNLLLLGELGPIKIGSSRLEVENIFGIEEPEQMTPTIKLASYEEIGLQFYYDENDILFNFHLKYYLSKKKRTSEIMELLFSDYPTFFLPSIELFKVILSGNIKLYYIENLSDQFSNFYYVSDKNVRMFFNHNLSEIFDGASLFYIGVDNGSSMKQAIENEAVEMTYSNLIIPPLYNEIEMYPKGKKVDF